MPSRPPFAPARAAVALLVVCAALLPSLSCAPDSHPLLPRSQTWAELRTIRRSVSVTPPEEAARPPHPRERLVDGEAVSVAAEGLAWLRRDGGATLLVRGPAELTLRSDAIGVTSGRIFIDTPAGLTTEIITPGGALHLAHVRASIDVSAAATEVYVLSGEVRAEGNGRAAAGERLTLSGTGKEVHATVASVLSWEDWTGGLATTDRAAEPAPYGVGTIGARRPGDQGSPRFPLSIQRLDVRVRIERDFAVTEVDEVFFNPSSEVVEGLYRFRTPDGAVLHRFGVDREGDVVWGRVKEKKAAVAQYESNVYQGSTEDPALLEWDAPGVYRARLYPIGPGETRRVVVSYAEWLGRTGAKLDRRLYVYPMAAEGAEESLPHIEELYATIDLGRSGAKDVRAGMAGVREGNALVVREHDLVPRADLAVELFDEGLPVWRGYQAPHTVDTETLAPTERAEALQRSRTEAEYVLVPVADVGPALAAPAGLDLSIVIDTSAGTEPAALAVARAATGALLAHLGKSDRAVVWAGDASLRPVVPGRDKLAPLDEAGRREVLAHLAVIERGGATDLGAMLAAAAESLDPSPGRRGAVVYVGDGAATVGELSLTDLRARLARLPRPVRIFGLGVGDGADLAVLAGLSRGAFAERLGDATAAARAALRLLEVAERSARLGATIDLGPGVERIYPRDLGALVEGEAQVVVGRIVGPVPTSVTVASAAGATTVPLQVNAIDDSGDLSRRWAEGRLGQLLDEAAGHAALVDLGSRHGIITPVTSLYVPTTNEMGAEERADLERRRRERREKQVVFRAAVAPTSAENGIGDARAAAITTELTFLDDVSKEGGTGTRAKGEEGSMGNPGTKSAPGSIAGLHLGGQATAAVAAPVVTAPAPSATAAFAAAAPPAERVRGPVTGGGRGGDGPLPAVPAPDGKRAAEVPGAGTINPHGSDQSAVAQTEHWTTRSRVDPTVGEISMDEGGSAKDVPLAHGWIRKTGDLGNAGSDGDKRLADRLAALRETHAVEVTVRLGDVSHVAWGCSGAAAVPFEERAALWRERLGAATGNAQAVARVYRQSLSSCEAPTWRERSRLLSMLLDAMPSVRGKVELWREMFTDLGAADALYRGMLARVRSPVEVRTLHDALGLKSIDPGLLERLLKEARTPGERVTRLRALVGQWPDDFALALRLLDLLEDAGDDAGARDLGRALRARPDADARVRTAVGELYRRLAARDSEPSQRALDESEGKRAFGEIVEFAPDDPIARRRLGDLLRAHGWYAEAARQYETLARLSPDDGNVALLLAAAAQGLGKLEEAVRWTERGGAAGSPDEGQGPARTARAFAATWLGWGRLEALAAGRADEASALAARLARVRSSERLEGGVNRGTRVALTWAHPELHPSLWSNALGAAMPAPEGDVTLGIAAATVPARDDAFVEVRLEPDELEHASRLGAAAVLTVVFDEGTPEEKIVKTALTFTRRGRPSRRFSLRAGAVKEVTP